MQITVFGASGRVGRQVVDNILVEGEHTLVVFVHNHSSFSQSPKLKIVMGDIHSQADVTRAVAGSDMVISALGSWGTKTKDILTSGMTNIISAMQDSGVKRIISLTGSDAVASGDKPGLINRLSHAVIMCSPMRRILIDGENHIKLLEDSDLDYTVIRSPVMRNGSGQKGFSLDLNRPKPWQTVKRSFVASSLVNQISTTDYIRQAPFIKSV